MVEEAFQVDIDPAHGGRWTSLIDPTGKQWLWQRPNRARDTVVPGQPFVDVGGIEECLPTIGGQPDHGDIWTRPWHEHEDGLTVTTGHFQLFRRLQVSADIIIARYRLSGPPGARFIWALHALLDPREGTRIEATPGPCRAWPGHTHPVETQWPAVLGIAGYDVLGPDDGTAMFCVLIDQHEVRVRQGNSTLHMRIESDDQPVSIGIWRNLNGYPWDGTPPYRNFAVEPMLGRVFDLSAAEHEDAAVLPASGECQWCIRIAAD